MDYNINYPALQSLGGHRLDGGWLNYLLSLPAETTITISPYAEGTRDSFRLNNYS